ncbi:MAG: polyphosphate kinase 2 family protein [Acidobacteria bacterium]|nr:polyphosphate kinase 2 family protein [Acidobacteriota bacterium]
MEFDRHRVSLGTPVDLGQYPPDDTGEWERGKAKKRFKDLNRQLETLQELLYAQGKERLLVVLQAIDAGGKDSTIRKVFDRCNPQGVHVTSFKKPSSREVAHDYLWRVHPHVPGDGEISVFNRSHYEDVLIARVHNLVEEEVWSRRYAHIRNFEQMLVEEGVTIRKFFLQISPEEQRARFQRRLDDPAKHWKFDLADLSERDRWADYQAAFEDMLSETSTADSPWYVIPANHKWYRNLAISKILVDTLDGLHMSYPPAAQGLDQIIINDVP